MTQHPPADDRLSLTPPMEAGDAEFLAGFSRRAGEVARIWPGQPGAPSPWVPCEKGCCLVLVVTHTPTDVAGQWLRFLMAEFLVDRHRVDGWVKVPSPLLGPGPAVLIVEAGDVFEGVAS